MDQRHIHPHVKEVQRLGGLEANTALVKLLASAEVAEPGKIDSRPLDSPVNRLLHITMLEIPQDNGMIDECEPDEDCNGNLVQDICDLADGTSDDLNGTGVPDEQVR